MSDGNREIIERVWSKQKADIPTFADDEAETAREIPAVLFERR